MQNRGALPSSSHDLAEFGQISNGGVPFSLIPAVGSWILDPSPGSASSLTQTDQELDVIPRFLPAGTYDAVAVNVSVAGSTGAVFRIAIYSDNNGTPGALLAQSVATDATTAGIRQVTLTAPFTIPAGGAIVWGGTVTQGAPTTKPAYTRIVGQTFGPVTTGAPTDFTINTVSSWFTSGVSAAPPATWTSTSRFNSAPRFAFRRSA